MIANVHITQNLRARADVNMAANHRQHYLPSAGANSHLLKDQTIGPDPRSLVDDNAILMWQQQATLNLTAKRDIRTRHHTPESMAQNSPFLHRNTQRVARLHMTLTRPEAGQQRPGRMPRKNMLFFS
jgi:hypothetical protein